MNPMGAWPNWNMCACNFEILLVKKCIYVEESLSKGHRKDDLGNSVKIVAFLSKSFC